MFGKTKGMVFTLDAMFALLFVIVFLFAILTYYNQEVRIEIPNYSILGAETLLSVEESGSIYQYMATANATNLTADIDWLLPNLCFNVTVYDTAGEYDQFASNCWKATQTYDVSYVSYIYNGQPYYAMMRMEYE